jgi:hypothetical protein
MATRTLLSSLLALLLSSPALAENSVKVCVDDPSGLTVKTGELGSGSCPSLATPYERPESSGPGPVPLSRLLTR